MVNKTKVINYKIIGQEAIVDIGTDYAGEVFAGYSKNHGSETAFGCVEKNGKIKIDKQILENFDGFKIDVTPCELQQK